MNAGKILIAILTVSLSGAAFRAKPFARPNAPRRWAESPRQHTYKVGRYD
jgi:hypothetical protein